MTLQSLKDTRKNFAHSPFLCPSLFALGLLAILAMYIWKAPLEIQGEDEMFYLMIPKRLIDGDALLTHEWHGSQLSALLILPFVKLHLMLLGTDGILLHFRYLYIAVLVVCTVIIYVRLRSYRIFGVIASLFFFLFIPYDIMALSYDSMGIIFMALTCTLLATAKGKTVYFVSGLLFAAAVLCTPYLILAYALFSLILFVYCALCRTARPLRLWGLFTLGAVALAIPVIAFILSRATIDEITRSLPYIFSDPTHPTRTLKDLIYSYIFAFLCTRTHNIAVINAAFVLLYIVTVIIALVDRNRTSHRIRYLLVSFAVAAVILVSYAPVLIQKSHNLIMLPLVYVGFMSFIVSKKKNLPVFLSFFCVGIAYTISIHFASNQAAKIISCASTVVNIGSILLLGGVIYEMAAEGIFTAGTTYMSLRTRGLCIAVVLLFALQFSLMTYTRINHKFSSETDNRLLTEVISEGVYKGIRVTAETRNAYMHDLLMLQPLKDRTGTVFIAAQRIYLYMTLSSLKIGAQCPWVTSQDSDVERLADYYAMNPEKVPDYILVPSYSETDPDIFRREILDVYGFREEVLPNSAESGAVLYVR